MYVAKGQCEWSLTGGIPLIASFFTTMNVFEQLFIYARTSVLDSNFLYVFLYFLVKTNATTGHQDFRMKPICYTRY